MKQLLSLLNVLVISTPLVPLSLSTITNNHYQNLDLDEITPKLTELRTTEEATLNDFVPMSDTTAIINFREQKSGPTWNEGENTYFFDKTKINDENKGFTLLMKTPFVFYNWSSTIGIIGDTQPAFKVEYYYFDSTKINDENKGLIKLNKKIADFTPLSSTIGIVQEKDTNQLYYFDSTKINNESQGFTDLGKKGNFNRWSDTTGILNDSSTKKSYYFDISKINETNKGLIELDKKVYSLIRLSDTIGIICASTTGYDQYYLFDATEINDGLQEFTYLFSEINFFREQFIPLSSTTALLIKNKPDVDEKIYYYYFDSTKINDENKGFTYLTNTDVIADFSPLSDNAGIFISHLKTYYFDGSKINDENKGFTDLNRKTVSFSKLSDTTGIFRDFELKQLFYFDKTKINEITKGFTRINYNHFSESFTPWSAKSGILENEAYYLLEI